MRIKINNQDLGEIATIDTYQQFTSGAAEDCLIEDYNREHDTDYIYDNFDWKYDMNKVTADLANASWQWLVDNVVDDYVVKEIGHIEGSFSPTYYNYQTDSWEAEWVIDEKALYKYIEYHKQDYETYCRDSNWVEHIEWRDEDDPKKQELTILSMLDYYLNHEFDVDSYFGYMYDISFDSYLDNITMECLEEDNNEKGES